jgi:hypothetical protein
MPIYEGSLILQNRQQNEGNHQSQELLRIYIYIHTHTAILHLLADYIEAAPGHAM